MSLKDNKKTLFCKNKYQFAQLCFLLTALCHHFLSTSPRAPHAEHCRHKQQRQHRITERCRWTFRRWWNYSARYDGSVCSRRTAKICIPLFINHHNGCMRTTCCIQRTCILELGNRHNSISSQFIVHICQQGQCKCKCL